MGRLGSADCSRPIPAGLRASRPKKPRPRTGQARRAAAQDSASAASCSPRLRGCSLSLLPLPKIQPAKCTFYIANCKALCWISQSSGITWPSPQWACEGVAARGLVRGQACPRERDYRNGHSRVFHRIRAARGPVNSGQVAEQSSLGAETFLH